MLRAKGPLTSTYPAGASRCRHTASGTGERFRQYALGSSPTFSPGLQTRGKRFSYSAVGRCRSTDRVTYRILKSMKAKSPILPLIAPRTRSIPSQRRNSDTNQQGVLSHSENITNTIKCSNITVLTDSDSGSFGNRVGQSCSQPRVTTGLRRVNGGRIVPTGERTSGG